MSDIAIARAGRRYVYCRGELARIDVELRRAVEKAPPGELGITTQLRQEATEASYATLDAYLDLMLAVRDEH